MLDVVFVVVIGAFFVGALLFVRGCDALSGGESDER
jgi:hypothetical protein